MRTRTVKALCGALLALGLLNACAPTKATVTKVSTRKPPPSPAELNAIKHYKLGIDSYANDKYAEAISHWKTTLKNDPTNTSAADYIVRAQNMLKVVKAAPKKPAAK